MYEWLVVLTEEAVPFINLVALLFIVIGTVEVLIFGLKANFDGSGNHRLRDVWLRYARWLVAGLTLQLGADILETAITPSWDDIGKLAAIAVIRTFLNYFLERDLMEVRERQHEAVPKEE